MSHFEEKPIDGGIEYSLGPIRFTQPAMTPHAEPHAAFRSSLAIFAATRDAVAEAAADSNLSDIGRARKIEPVMAEAVGYLAGSWWTVKNFEESIARMESALFGVPTLDPTHAACAIEDREIRDYYRSLPASQRLAMIADMQKDPAAHQRVQIAMLRSPLALVEQEAQLLRHVWHGARRAENPTSAAAIDHGRESVNWARRGLMQVAGLFRSVNRDHIGNDEKLLHTVLTDANPRRATGFGVFGFSNDAAERYGLRLKSMGYEKNAEGCWKKVR